MFYFTHTHDILATPKYTHVFPVARPCTATQIVCYYKTFLFLDGGGLAALGLISAVGCTWELHVPTYMCLLLTGKLLGSHTAYFLPVGFQIYTWDHPYSLFLLWRKDSVSPFLPPHTHTHPQTDRQTRTVLMWKGEGNEADSGCNGFPFTCLHLHSFCISDPSDPHYWEAGRFP